MRPVLPLNSLSKRFKILRNHAAPDPMQNCMHIKSQAAMLLKFQRRLTCCGLQAKAIAIAPFAAISLDRFKDIGKSARKLYDRIYYGEVLPPVGSAEMSYARLLENLENKTIKRIVLLADSRYALVEVCQQNSIHPHFMEPIVLL